MYRTSVPVFIIVAAAIFSSCENTESKEDVARRSCSTCHLFPDPSLLDKKTWQHGVLPEMALRMGLDMSKLPGTTAEELNEILKALPANPMVSEEEWKSIQEYYSNTAPDSLTLSQINNPGPIEQFAVSPVSIPITGGTLLTMVRRDPFSENIFVGTRKGDIFQLGPAFTAVDSFPIGSPPSDILFQQGLKPIVCRMGIMDPNDRAAGAVIQVDLPQKNTVVLIDSIKRPVDFERADLNNDGRQDLVVSAFGNFTGGLYVYENADGGYRGHIVHHFPGTRKTIVKDLNDDGLPDILALITQGDEQIALFTNRGNFRFSYQILLKFPPVYGSSYFELVDFNGDGKDDILYTNGDNADYSPILKPYHGVRIFLNDGDNHFRQSWFYPMYGASMARAVDFDQDGDVDIAAISFFPDFKKHPEHGFIYFENDRGSFTPCVTGLAASSRWITMEAADVDNDQDIDLILAALAFPTGVPDSLFQVWQQNRTSLLVLKNNLR